MILILVIVLPVLILMSMAVLAGFLGSTLRRSSAEKYKDSEILAVAQLENDLTA